MKLSTNSLLFIAVLILFSGCTQTFENYSPEELDPEELCEQTSTQAQIESCKEQIGERPELTFADCEDAPYESLKYECIATLNEKDPKLEVCNQIESDAWRDYCLISVAADNQNLTMCDTLDNTNGYRDTCYEEIAIQTGNEDLCAEKQRNQELCVARVAINTSRSELCDQVGSLQNECIAEVSVVMDDFDLCLESDSDSCIIDIAAQRGDASLCRKTSDSPDSCYIAVARDAGKPELCKKVEHDFYEGCLVQSARGTLNPEICQQITSEFDKNRCFYNLVSSHY